MSNYIIKYSEDERVRYISHLDFMRTFYRTARRSGLNMAYTSGFNPHPIMTIAMPLSVGVTSETEYMKIGFSEDYSEEEVKERLNSAFPKGISVLAVKKLDGKETDFAKINKVVYKTEIECNDTSLFDDKEFMKNNSLVVMKKTKSGEKESDIRPYIYDFFAEKIDKTKMTVNMCIAAGNDYNLKGETVLLAMEKYSKGLKITFSCSHRVKILANDREIL
ncbi:MAG: TIGR03936 family radical SAM-associated protein [Clostridia bacterium]|nr:TIGR03936 family radical SAM-associated protein [Clostridia bacterium]